MMNRLFNYNDCNCSYTTSSGQNVNVSIAALMEIMKQIPESPKIFSMDISLFTNNLLPKNTIILSKDVADALEEAMKKAQ